jgi:lactoylglutathione lyase
MALRAFPILYARHVEALAAFYVSLGYERATEVPGEDGGIGYVGLLRGDDHLGIATEESPVVLAGVQPGPGPRHEMFVYVDDLDAAIREVTAAGAKVLRPPVDMVWGERIAFVQDPEGNMVSLAQAAG